MGLRLYESDEERREIIKELRALRTANGEVVFPFPETMVMALRELLQEQSIDKVLAITKRFWRAQAAE